MDQLHGAAMQIAILEWLITARNGNAEWLYRT
jgi:hypothetical protein